MNRTKLLFSFSASTALSLIALMGFLYSEHQQISHYRSKVSDIGHEVIEIRDTITHHALTPDSDPYHLTRDLVRIEREIEQLIDHYRANEQFGLYQLETHAQLLTFSQSVTIITDALDHVIGLIIVNDALLDAVSSHLNLAQTKDLPAARALLIDNIALFEDRESHLGANIDTFRTVDAQKQRFFKLLLAHENMAFVEQSELTLTELETNLRNQIMQLLLAFVLLVFTTIFVVYLLRLNELKRNNRSYQEAIERTQKAMQAKSLFLATMSHELRTPMNGVLGMAQIIKEETTEKHIRQHAEMMIHSGQHLVTLLNDVLDFSKIEQGKMSLEIRAFQMEEVLLPLKQSLTPLANEKNIAFQIDNTIAHHCLLLGDSARLRQILFNLAGNAIKFTQEGSVTITCHYLTTPDPMLNIIVLDTGIGIAHDKLDTIFAPFEQAESSTTRKFGGTGLGLSIVKQITELMGGEIAVYSKVGVGSQFTLSIPIEIETHQTVKPNINVEQAPAC